MKHTFTCILLLLSISAFGQTEKGNSFISGNISTGYSANAYPKEALRKSNDFSTSAGISYGKFVKDNIVWRTDLSGNFYRNFWQSSLGSQTTRTIYPNTNVSLSSVGLYYFGKDRWRGFIGGGINVTGNFNKTRSTETGIALPYDYTQKNSKFAINPLFEVGALYFFNKHLALELSTTANSFPINNASFYAGLLYWIKPTSFEVESKELTALQKGRWVLGGGFDINTSRFKNTNPYYSSTTSESANNGFVHLQLGKFVKNRTIAGVNLGYSSHKNIHSDKNGQQIENYATNYNVSIFLKKYLIPSRFTPYVGFQVNYDRAEYKQVISNSGNNTSHSNSYGLGPSLGLAYVISNHFLVETQLAEFYLSHNVETKTWEVT